MSTEVILKALIALLPVIVLIIVTDGGDFNPFDDDGASGPPTQPVASASSLGVG